MTELIPCRFGTSHTGLQVQLKSDGSIAAERGEDCKKMLSTEWVHGVKPLSDSQDAQYEKHKKMFGGVKDE